MKMPWFVSLVMLVLVVRGAAANADQPTEIERLIKQLGSPQFADREAASDRLKTIGEPAARALREAASSKDPEVRWRAAALLAELKGAGIVFDGRSLAEWARLLTKGNGQLRRQAALALGRAGPQAKWELPALRHALQDKDVAVRWRAAHAIWKVDNRLQRDALGIIRDAGTELLERLPSLVKPEDVEETQAMLFAALEIAEGRPQR